MKKTSDFDNDEELRKAKEVAAYLKYAAEQHTRQTNDTIAIVGKIEEEVKSLVGKTITYLLKHPFWYAAILSALLSFGTIYFLEYLIFSYKDLKIAPIIEMSRGLLMAIGAGFFGLLAFLIAGVTITNQYLEGMDLSKKENFFFEKMAIEKSVFYLRLNILLVFGIVLVFLCYITTFFPFPLNSWVYGLFAAIISFVFYLSLLLTIVIISTNQRMSFSAIQSKRE